MMAGNGLVEVVTRWCGRRTTLFLWSAAIFTLALVGVGLADSFVLSVVLLCLAVVAYVVQSPVRQAFFNRVVPSRQRATVLSFDSMISGGASAAEQSGLGHVAQRQGFSAGYLVGGVFTVAALPLAYRVRQRDDDADHFVGSRPEFACATPGLPAISQVDGRVSLDPDTATTL